LQLPSHGPFDPGLLPGGHDLELDLDRIVW
jgi:hypothetical protein